MNMMCEYWQSLIVDETCKGSFRSVYHLGYRMWTSRRIEHHNDHLPGKRFRSFAL
jgi:hypothetical protein